MATIEPYDTARGRRYRVRYRTPEGRQTDKRGFPTKKAAEAFANRVEANKLDGTYVAPSAGRVTVGELGLDWLDRQKAHLKPSTYRLYESGWRTHVEPRWGETTLTKIVFSDVQAWVAQMAAERGASSVRTSFEILARILDDAVHDRRLPSNPARGVKLPRKTRKPSKYLTQAQVWQLAGECGRYKSLTLLLAYVGLRWGEAAGLRVRDVDFLRRRALLHENAVQVGSKIVVGSLKGHKHRSVPLPRFVVDELAKHCVGKGPDDLLWPAQDGGHLGPPGSEDSWLSGAVARCQTAANEARLREGKHPTTPIFPRVTAHDLRHTAASLAISSGANVKAVQRMLGHASAAMTLDIYADLFDDDLEEVARRMEESVGKMWAETGKQPAPESGAGR
ncbi:tyrosine-type recombinase/integrase [Rhodococcus hoagii]|nr:tyrosine-type recombinase/integrase [Prescottella equi]